jgi:farnesyl-diphosphate farnesyltransferase
MDRLDPILAGVSRSFYLSLRLLPGGMRPCAGLAYLIARATDTMADSSGAEPSARVSEIRRLLEVLESGGRWERRIDFLVEDAPERALIDSLADLGEAFHRLRPEDRSDVLGLLTEITEGQIEDLTRAWPVRSDEELDRYIYLVAGSVGKFWTRIGCRNVRRFARRDEETMIATGIAYGKGLQLVNVLRDLPRDLAGGRQYLPEPSDACWRAWKGRCVRFLREGANYSGALRRGRARYASLLPWHLGASTVALLPDHRPAAGAGPIKVGRDAVNRALRRGLLGAVSDTWHRRLEDEAFRRLRG